jgi:4-hydroxy-3-methylbut-2-enyl diphosphate reductase
VLVEEVIAALRGRFDVTVEEVVVRREDIAFNVPRVLSTAAV